MVHALDVDLGPGVLAWFTGRDAGNLSAWRPHRPDRLARDRRAAFGRHGGPPTTVHLMRQVHGTAVTRVTDRDEPGTVVPGVDGLVTTLADRPLAVLTADCLPVLLAGPRTVAAVHAGRVGLLGGVLQEAVGSCAGAGDDPATLVATIGPGIRACCYEVPENMRDEAAAVTPDAVAETTWGAPAIDLPAAAGAILAVAGVTVTDVGRCTRCEADDWFSHRADPASGRQAGVVVRVDEQAAA